ncbi:MAG: NAD(P)H-dependent glycerol-3-phosphate dehydrogenase [Mollicutes bacterium]|nr:NAD(P)H-dependent glycerol-3-phosphate dehydrogenase [Mollicutes bacterium]
MKIALIGTGIYGIAIASTLVKNNHHIVMWTENKDKYNEYIKTKNLKSIYKNFDMPKRITLSLSLEETLKDAKVIFITCASKYVKNITKDIKKYYVKNIPICIAAKGIDEENCELLSNIVKRILNTRKIAVISGPTFAVDILNNNPVALAVASADIKTKYYITNIMQNDTLKLRPSRDIIGVQICGSVKNIIAIASGILGGLGYTESTQAFLINESLHDIKKLISLLGGKKRTILSFAGVGDLLMTSMSKKSRNYSFGYVIGTAKNKKEIESYLNSNTVEGFNTLETVIRLLKKKHINIPLIYVIDDIVNGKKNPHYLVDFLINKD